MDNGQTRNLADQGDATEDLFDSLVAEYHAALLAGREPADRSTDFATLDAETRAKLTRAEGVLQRLVKARHAFVPAAGIANGQNGPAASVASVSFDPHVSRASDPPDTEERVVDTPHDVPAADERNGHVPTVPLGRLGRFYLERESGRGGLGVVFLAFDPVLKRRVALKVPRPEVLVTPDVRARFEREAHAAARLAHPHLVPVYEVGQAGLISYIVSAYCAGPNLALWLKERSRPLAPQQAAQLIAELADAIHYAHTQGVLHRDIKPSNILMEPLEAPAALTAADCLTTEASVDAQLSTVPKLVDFGLAKVAGAVGGETRTGIAMGTLGYMAPEQAEGRTGEIGPPADVHGLGAVLYELLTGRGPYAGASEAEILRRVVSEEPVRPSRVDARIPADVEAICLKCLEKHPGRRYETAAALAADLRRFVDGKPTLARPLAPAARLARWGRRRPALAGLITVSVVATLAFVVLSSVYIARLTVAREKSALSQAEAEESAKAAEAQEQLANRFMYASEMQHAYEALGHGEVEKAEQLLEKYQPGSRFAALRGFEWYHLKRRVHGERSTLKGHRGEVYAVAFQPDGRVLASGAEDGMIKFWDPVSAQELATIPAHRSCVNMVAYSPDGQIIASASCDHTIKLWHATTHELLATLDGHPDEVRCLAISPDGRLLASGGNDPVVRLWDLTTSELLKSCNSESATVDFLAWRNDSRSLVIVAAKTQAESHRESGILIWDLAGENPVRLAGAANNVPILSIGSDVYLGTDRGEIHVIDESHAVRKEPLIGHTNGVAALASPASGDRVALGFGDGTICIWQRIKLPFEQTLAGHTGRVQALAFSPANRSLLASASFDGTVKLWDLEGDSIPRAVLNCVKDGTLVDQHTTAISPDLRFVAYRGATDGVAVVDIAGNHLPIIEAGTGAPCAPAPGSGPLGLDFLPSDPPVLFGIPSPKGIVSSWNVTRRQFSEGVLESSLQLPRDEMFSSNGRQLIRTTATSVAVSDRQTGEIWCRIEIPPTKREPPLPFVVFPSVIRSPDGSTLAVSYGADAGSFAWLIDLSAKQYRRPIPRIALAVCDQGKLIAVAGEGNSVMLVDPTSGTELFNLWHDGEVQCVAFSPDARTLATMGRGRVYLWHVPTGGAITKFETGSFGGIKLQFSRDGRKLAALTRDYLEGDTAALRFFVWEGVDGS